MQSDYVCKQGDSGPSFVQQLSLEDGSIPSLVGALVALDLRSINDGTTLVTTGLVEVANGPSAIVAYTPTSADTAVAGDYMGNWIVTFPDTTQMSFPTDGYFWVEVQPNLVNIPGTALAQTMLSTSDIIRPSVQDLADLCRARTVQAGSGGQETGTFNNLTRPSFPEADRLIDISVTHVLSSIGFDMPNWAYAQAKQLVLFYAAQLVEVTFYALTVTKGESPYDAYKALYTDAAMALTAMITNNVGGAPRQAVYSVPVMTTRQMRFKEMWHAIQVQDFSVLPDDMRYPMGPKGIPFPLPANGTDWSSFNWGLVNWDTWLEVSI